MRPLAAIRAFYRRLKILESWSGIAAFLLFAAAASVFHVGRLTPDPLDKLLPALFVRVLQVVYLVAGLALLIGLGRRRPRLQAYGLIAIVVSVLARALALIAAVGLRSDVATQLFFDAVLLWMCLVRLEKLFGHPVVEERP